MGPGMAGMRGAHRGLTRDRSVLKHELAEGIWKRIFAFASPYKGMLGLFLVFIIVDAFVGVANPLIYRTIINNGVLKHNSSVVIHFALLIAFLAIFDTALTVGQRALSVRIGEGLIFDMRSKVFEHVSKMP